MATQVRWPVGRPVTLVRFRNSHEVIVDRGKVVGNVDTGPAGGRRSSVESVRDSIEDCCDVRGFRQGVVLGNLRRVLEGFCALEGIKVIGWPWLSPFVEGSSV